MGEENQKRISPIVLILGGILAIVALFLLLPSSRSERRKTASQKLDQQFVGPASISHLYDGFFVTSRNKHESVGATTEAQISVFAPRASTPYSSRFLSEVDDKLWKEYGNNAKHVCLLAPDPSSTEWTFFAKVWIALTLKKDSQSMLKIGDSLSRPNPIVLEKLKAMWSQIPAGVQIEAEEILNKNRDIVKGLTGLYRYYQTSFGKVYEIKVAGGGTYDFIQTLQVAKN